mgnify:FL=1
MGYFFVRRYTLQNLIMDRVKDDAPLAALVQKYTLDLQKCREEKAQALKILQDSDINIHRLEGAIHGIKEAAKLVAGENIHNLVVSDNK